MVNTRQDGGDPSHRVAVQSLWVAIIFGVIGTLIAAASLLFAFLGYIRPDASVIQKAAAVVQIFTGQSRGASTSLNIEPPGPAASGPTVTGPRPAVTAPAPRAQPQVAIQSATTNGITASVTGLYLRDARLFANIQIVNNTGQRFYFQDAEGDPAQAFALANGGVLTGVSAAQMPACSNGFAACIDNANQMSPSHFSYLDAQSNVAIGLNWYLGEYKETTRQGSFSLVLIGRLLTADANPADGPPPQMFRFNFTGIPVAR
jgi:hypothetical protein